MPRHPRPLAAAPALAHGWLESARRCRVAIGVLAALAAGLTASPQATDLLITLGQGSSVLAWTAMAAATAWLSLNVWFWASVSLRAASPHPEPGATWLPDLLAACAFAAVAAGLWNAADAVPTSMLAEMGEVASGAGRLRIASGGLLAAGCLAFAAGRAASSRAALGRRPAAFMAALSAGVALAGMAAYGSDPVGVARLLPPGATLLFAASGLICGGTLLARAGSRTGAPVLLLAFAAAAALAVLRDRDVLPDNHDVRRLAGPARTRPDLKAAFLSFLDEMKPGDGPAPVVLVATGGGGLAASYWTATVLADLAEASPAFAAHMFAISGVSGGALGALEYVAGRSATGCAEPGAGSRRCAQLALSQDFLGPALGALLYPDLFQRFVPVPVFADRQTALEQAWERRWRDVFGDDRIGGPFLDLWEPGRPWPALLLNGTSLANGGRLVTSNLALDEPGLDLLTTLGAEVRASTAAGDSARFPYISPLGAIRRGGPTEARTDSLGDGGYFENLGATTLLDVLDELDGAARAAGRPVRFAVIQIVSDPDIGPDGEALPGAKGASSAALLPLGLTGPAEVLLRSRAARGAYASAALARRVASLGGAYVPVRLGRSPTGATAPLGWSLSAVAREVIDAQWTRGCRERVLELTGFAERDAMSASGMTVTSMWRAAGCAGAGAGAGPPVGNVTRP